MRVAVVVFAACALACGVAHIAILRSVVRTAATRSTVEPGMPRPSFVVELLWAILPIVVLALVLTATWTKVRRQARPHPEAILEIAR